MAEAVANETWDQATSATEEGDLLGAFPTFDQVRGGKWWQLVSIVYL